jgi:hypothetical protein
VLPSGIVSTGWPAVRDVCAGFGVQFDVWQDGAGRAILAKRGDGTYACSVGGAVLSIPRQVGKTFLIGAIVFALCLLSPGLTVIWTAHRTRTAAETFSAMQVFAKRKKVKPHVLRVLTGSGDESIEFVNGSRVLFGSRERGFGLGFADVGVLVLDEAQRMTDTTMDDMIPTMNRAANPLYFLIGTPPRPTDPGEVFTRKRAECLSGESDDTLYIEFSAEQGAKPDDRKQWSGANPSYPHHTPVSAMLRMKKNLTVESFMREALGVWDDGPGQGAIPNWSDLAYLDSEVPGIVSHLSWALTASPVSAGEQWASIGKAGRTSEGFAHIEWVEHRKGTRWIVPTVKEHYEANGKLPIRMRPNGPEGAFIGDLKEAGVEVIEVSGPDEARATGALLAAASAAESPPTLRHLGQASLTKAVAYAVLRSGSDGAARWDSKKTTVEISPLVACTLALGGVPAPTTTYDVLQSVF